MLHDLEDLPLDARLAAKAADERLLEEYGGRLGASTVSGVLSASYRRLADGASIHHHLPLLAERFARAQLWSLARMAGHDTAEPGVLFLDTHDAARAKLAKALLTHGYGHNVLSFSAGTEPAEHIDPDVLTVMSEIGVPTSASFPKPFTEEMLWAADVVVLLSPDAAAQLPAELGGQSVPDVARMGRSAPQVEVWDVPEVTGRSLEELRSVRDELARRVSVLAQQLGLRPLEATPRS